MKGNFSLDGIVVNTEAEVRSREHAFSVMTNDEKIYILSAATSKEKATWIRAMMFASTGEIPDIALVDDRLRKTIMEKNPGGRISKSGWLGKQGEFSFTPNAMWKRRWFILKDDPGTDRIEYYTDENGSLKGTISLVDCKLQNLEGEGTSFVVVSLKEGKKREFILNADSDQDMKEWVRAINASMNAIQKERNEPI